MKIISENKKRGRPKKNKTLIEKIESKKILGFTLIELLAVIIILGILMIIAIPSVTEYISSSRKNSYIKTANQYIGGARNEVNSANMPMYDKNITYYIPSKCISLEKGGDSPFGELEEAYIVVTYDGHGYDYYWTSRDSQEMGILLTSEELLDEESIQTSIKELSTSVGVGDRDYILVLTDTCSMDTTPVLAETTIPEKGKLEENIDNTIATGSDSKFIFLNNHNLSIVLNDNTSESEIEIYNENNLVEAIATENVEVTDNKIIITNTENYNGTYIIFEDGYIEKDGIVIAKQESKWVSLNKESYVVVHNRIAYLSLDGNSLDEEFVNLDTIKPTIEEAVYGEDGFEEWGGSYYNFAIFEDDTIKLENIYDMLSLQNFSNHCTSFGYALLWLGDGTYRYWGGTAKDIKINNSFVTNANWSSSNVKLYKEIKLHKITNNKTKALKMNDKITDGSYWLDYKEEYSYKEVETTNIFYVEDYPFAYTPGMTWREWINSEYSRSTSLNDYTGEPWVFVNKEDLDKKISSGTASGRYISVIGTLPEDYRFESNYNTEHFHYCEGTIKFPKVKEDDYSLFGYDSDNYTFVGWRWDGGIIEDSIESYDLINYYLDNTSFTSGQQYVEFEAVFEEKK